jgi:uncharacterized protein
VPEWKPEKMIMTIAQETETKTEETTATEPKPKPKRGFAAMPRDKVRELARQGGVSAHASGKAYRWTPETAREAGRKGGLALHNKKRNGA